MASNFVTYTRHLKVIAKFPPLLHPSQSSCSGKYVQWS